MPKAKMGIPTRNQVGELLFPDFPDFKPNLTPKEVLQMGSFGGTYFRPIYSRVTGQNHQDEYLELPSDWFEGLPENHYTSINYRKEFNKYNIDCGGDLDMWETNNWIRKQDPYGWFQWYCRFYLGRRTDDDLRQVKRGLGVFGPRGRWRRFLINKCLESGLSPEDALKDYTISPKVRQLLQHWGYQLTLADLKAHK